MSSRKRDFNFDEMLGTGGAPGQPGGAPVNTGTQEIDFMASSAGSSKTGAAAPETAPTQVPVNTEVQNPVSTGTQKPGFTGTQETVAEQLSVEQLLAALLADHAGLRTGTAKKTTFDFTPEFARALKRWSVDTDTSMRDLVLKAVAEVMPSRYLQEYRNQGNRK